MIIAEPQRSASHAMVRARTTAMTVRVDGVWMRCESRDSSGPPRVPATAATRRKPKARAAAPRIVAIEASRPCESPWMMVSNRSPRTSSISAAPRMICPSWVSRCPRSERTRAVMPTLVAVRVAAAMIDGMSDNPRQRQATYPSTKGSKTPTTATVIDVGPTRIRRARSVSRPIANRRINTPSSARSWIASWPGSIQPSTDGPAITPPINSPRTAG